MRRYVLAALLVLVPCSVQAETSTAILESIPLIIGGIGPKAQSSFGAIEMGTTTRVGPGAFSIEGSGHKGAVTVTEAAPCVFDMALAMDGREMGKFVLDANLLETVIYDGNPKTARIETKFVGKEGMLMMVVPDGRSKPFPPDQTITSKADVADMNAAVTALKVACP